MTDLEQKVIDKLLRNEFNLGDDVMIASKHINGGRLAPGVVISVINYYLSTDKPIYEVVLLDSISKDQPTICLVSERELFPRGG